MDDYGESMKKDEVEKQRQKHNKNIVERMKRGEDLVEFDEMESWFPPRPMVKKDKKLMAKLYDNKEDEKEVKRRQSKTLSKLSVCRPSKSQ